MQKEVRRYLLGQLEEAEQERIELQLLTDSSFGEEFDTVVDELTDQYVKNELTDDERKRAEKYFLNTPVRQQKLEFAKELLSHAEAERGEPAQMATARPIAQPAAPGLLDQIRAFWRRPSFAHVGLSAAVVLVVAGLVFFLFSFGNSEYMSFDLALNNANRSVSTAPAPVKLADAAGLRVNLSIPDEARNAKDYRVKLVDENGVERDLTIDRWRDQTITVTIPAALLSRGSYVVQLSMVKPDGSEERVRGSYNFVVE